MKNNSKKSNFGILGKTSGSTTTNGTTTGSITTGGNYMYISPYHHNGGYYTNTITTTDTFDYSGMVEYIDIFYVLMGIDMDYRRFSIMTPDEKKSFIRDVKLKKIIGE